MSFGSILHLTVQLNDAIATGELRRLPFICFSN